MTVATRTAATTDWTPVQEERLAELYAAGWTLGTIAGDLGRSERAIKHRVKHLGLTRPVRKDQTGRIGGAHGANRPLIEQTDDADDMLAARMAAAGGSFAAHDRHLRCYGPRMAGGLAVMVGWATAGEQA
jgi:AraC-like DNA-binding protein